MGHSILIKTSYISGNKYGYQLKPNRYAYGHHMELAAGIFTRSTLIPLINPLRKNKKLGNIEKYRKKFLINLKIKTLIELSTNTPRVLKGKLFYPPPVGQFEATAKDL